MTTDATLVESRFTALAGDRVDFPTFVGSGEEFQKWMTTYATMGQPRTITAPNGAVNPF